MIMPKLRSTYDGRRGYKSSYEGRKAVLVTIHLKNSKIISESVCKLAYDILNRNLITLQVTIASPSYDKLKIIL